MQKIYHIKSNEGFDEVQFGLTSEDIKKIICRVPSKIRKNNFDENDIDMYEDFFVYFDEQGRCEAIEFTRNSKVMFCKIDLFSEYYIELEKIFLKKDPNLEIDDTGFTSYKYGIGVYVPYKEKVNEKIESVIIFKRGYYA